jgi:hypothetical protein
VPLSEVHSKDNVVTAFGEDIVLSDVPLNRPFLRIFLFEFDKSMVNFLAISVFFATFKKLLKVFGQVAQSVEQRTENPCVGGSIPPLPIY